MAPPGPQSVAARPSAWGGLTLWLDTPGKRWAAIAVLLALMVAAPRAFGACGTVILSNGLL